jgi:hypothetical protein
LEGTIQKAARLEGQTRRARVSDLSRNYYKYLSIMGIERGYPEKSQVHLWLAWADKETFYLLQFF